MLLMGMTVPSSVVDICLVVISIISIPPSLQKGRHRKLHLFPFLGQREQGQQICVFHWLEDGSVAQGNETSNYET